MTAEGGARSRAGIGRTLIDLAAPAIFVATCGIAIWWLLGTNRDIGRWLFAAFLVGHGWVHIMFAFPRPAGAGGEDPSRTTEYPFDLSESWLVSSLGVDARAMRAAGIALVAAVIVVFLLAGLATVGLVVPVAWWPALVAGGSILSIALLVAGFSPSLVLGFAIDAALLWVVFSGAWLPA